MTWRQLSQLLAFLSKFPTLHLLQDDGHNAFYFHTLKWRNSNSVQNYELFSNRQFFPYVCRVPYVKVRALFYDTASLR